MFCYIKKNQIYIYNCNILYIVIKAVKYISVCKKTKTNPNLKTQNQRLIHATKTHNIFRKTTEMG